MVRFDRGSPPNGFVDLARGLQAEWSAKALSEDQTISTFWATARPKLREAARELFARNQGKCAFCESIPWATTTLHIEHFRPKGAFPELAFDWANWLPACPTCNNKKSTLFPERDGVPSLVDPTTEEPREFLGFQDQFIFGRNRRGSETVDLVALNREGLSSERSWHLERLQYALLFARLVPDAAAKAVAREFVTRAIQPSARYSAMSRDYVEKHAPRLVQSSPAPGPAASEVDAGLSQLIERYSDQLEDLQ